LKITGFEASAEHAAFDAKGWIDVVPRLLVDVDHTVKIWAAELQSRVSEYIRYHLSGYIKGDGHRGVRVRPWRCAELQAWITRMTEEKRRGAGILESGPAAGSSSNGYPRSCFAQRQNGAHPLSRFQVELRVRSAAPKLALSVRSP
jgi:hypothetical protein